MNKFIHYGAVLACVFGIEGCSHSQFPSQPPQESINTENNHTTEYKQTIHYKPILDIPPGVDFNCSPDRISDDEHLTLLMSVPHGGDLNIHDPEGNIFYVVYDPGQDMDQSFVKREEFRGMAKLEINPAELRANSFKGKYEIVFSKDGWYQLSLSENLETDDGTPSQHCKVYFSKSGKHD